MTTSGIISQVELEVLKYAEPSTTTVSQLFTETLKYAEPSTATISQLFIEVLYTQVETFVQSRRGYKLLPTIN